MNKIIALVCIVSWAGFWSFGYLALSASSADSHQMTMAALLAAIGFLTGTFTYMALSCKIP